MRHCAITSGAAILLLAGLVARAEVQVTVERNPEGTPDFKFTTVPSPLRNDAAAKTGLTIVEGRSDPSGSRLSALNDGRLSGAADHPAEPELPAATRPVRAKDFEFTLDVSQVPDLQEWAETRLRPDLETWYPIIRDSLASDGFAAPKEFRVTVRPMEGVAGTSDTDIQVSAEWIRSQLKRPEWNEAIGSVIHELVHVVQQYKTRGNPGWLVEGIADYLRWFHYEPILHRPELQDPARARYSDSYQTTAGFLEYAARNHDHELVVKLNSAMRQGRYNPEIWKECTGMTVQELWNRYVKSLTNAGPAVAPSSTGREVSQPNR